MSLREIFGGIVMLRKYVVAFSVVALLAGSANQSKADGPPVAPVAAGATTAGVWIAGGFIGVVAALCLYDIWLKMDGQKNWDGTPKTKSSERMGGASGAPPRGGGAAARGKNLNTSRSNIY
jgi:hypothetical protein